MKKNGYVWCTYRAWSFEVLEGLLATHDLKCIAILTTKTCTWKFSRFEALGIKVFKMDPKRAFIQGSKFLDFIEQNPPICSFFYGWSWIVPKQYHSKHLCVTYHPGKLPNDRGGSPLQNQIRNGADWTYGNIIRISDGLDTGDIYASTKISLCGTIEDVWVRMTTSALSTTHEFFADLQANNLVAKKQTAEGTVFNRVSAGAEEIKPSDQTAVDAFNIVRAHNEFDSNSYVLKAFYKIFDLRIIIFRSELDLPDGIDEVELEHIDRSQSHMLPNLLTQVANGQKCLSLTFKDRRKLYINSGRIDLGEF